MNKFLMGANGRLILAGARPLVASSSDTLFLAVTDFYVGNTYAHPVFQRKAGTEDQNGGYADIPAPFTYTGAAPSTVQARVVPFDNPTGTAIVPWTDITPSVTVNNGAGLGYLPNVPSGADYMLQIRTGTLTASGSRRWGVGACVKLAGQSNMGSTLVGDTNVSTVSGTPYSENQYWRTSAFPGCYFGEDGFVVAWDGTDNGGTSRVVQGWNSASVGGGQFIRMLSANLSAKHGRKIPVCAAVWFFGSTGLGSMFPPGDSGKTIIYTNTGTTSGNIGWLSPPGYSPGDFEGIVLHQGEAESGTMSRADRLALLKQYYTYMLGLVGAHGRTAANFFFLPAILGPYSDPGVPYIENMRGAAYDLEAYAQANGWPKVKVGWNCIDLDPGDPLDTDPNRALHFHNIPGGNQYCAWGHHRMVQSVACITGCSTISGKGPKVGSITRSGFVATVAIVHEGGTALAARNPANPISGWYAHTRQDFDDTKGNPIAVTAQVAGAAAVAVTFPSGTVFPCYLKYMGGMPGTAQSRYPDPSNPVYDNVVYPTNVAASDQLTGLPLQPTVDALVVT